MAYICYPIINFFPIVLTVTFSQLPLYMGCVQMFISSGTFSPLEIILGDRAVQMFILQPSPRPYSLHLLETGIILIQGKHKLLQSSHSQWGLEQWAKSLYPSQTGAYNVRSRQGACSAAPFAWLPVPRSSCPCEKQSHKSHLQ